MQKTACFFVEGVLSFTHVQISFHLVRMTTSILPFVNKEFRLSG